VCTLGHDALSKMLVKCRNGKVTCRGIRGVYKTVGRAGWKARRCGWFCGTVAKLLSNHLCAKEIPRAGFKELSDLAPNDRFLSYKAQYCDVLWYRA